MNADGKRFLKTTDGTYVADASELRLQRIPKVLYVEGLEGVAGVRSFGIVGVDGHMDDPQGWRYLEQGREAKLLVIND